MLCAPEDMWMPLWKWDQMLKACPGIQALPAPGYCTYALPVWSANVHRVRI